MTLAPGAKLGPYEIVSAIGAGGMGEVFRARDTKLNRDVAIKVLPESFALDVDRLARFTRGAGICLRPPSRWHARGGRGRRRRGKPGGALRTGQNRVLVRVLRLPAKERRGEEMNVGS